MPNHKPFALSLSKCKLRKLSFDKLRTNGICGG